MQIWKKWKRIAEKIGDFQANLIFSVLYYLLFFPVGVVTKFLDFLGVRKFPEWNKTVNNSATMAKLKRQ